MRRVICIAVVLLCLGGTAFGAPRDLRQPRTRENPVVKAIKRIVATLGDLIIIPTP
jgi:hypothetical protein